MAIQASKEFPGLGFDYDPASALYFKVRITAPPRRGSTIVSHSPQDLVSIRFEIDAEVESGLDRAKTRTLIENATTLGFVDKAVS